jgi:choline transport protein
MVCCLFSMQNFDTVLSSSTGFLFVQVIEDAFGRTGIVVLASLFIFNGLGQGISVMTRYPD